MPSTEAAKPAERPLPRTPTDVRPALSTLLAPNAILVRTIEYPTDTEAVAEMRTDTGQDVRNPYTDPEANLSIWPFQEAIAHAVDTIAPWAPRRKGEVLHVTHIGETSLLFPMPRNMALRPVVSQALNDHKGASGSVTFEGKQRKFGHMNVIQVTSHTPTGWDKAYTKLRTESLIEAATQAGIGMIWHGFGLKGKVPVGLSFDSFFVRDRIILGQPLQLRFSQLEITHGSISARRVSITRGVDEVAQIDRLQVRYWPANLARDLVRRLSVEEREKTPEEIAAGI